MDPIKTGHERPVNKQAALLLAKAPWWAAYPEPAKKAILPMAPTLSWSAIIDYTAAPPQPFGKNLPIIDRRGIRIRMKEGAIGTIVGFCRCETVFTPRCSRSGHNGHRVAAPRHKEAAQAHYWWIEVAGEIIELCWHGKAKYVVK